MDDQDEPTTHAVVVILRVDEEIDDAGLAAMARRILEQPPAMWPENTVFVDDDVENLVIPA